MSKRDSVCSVALDMNISAASMDKIAKEIRLAVTKRIPIEYVMVSFTVNGKKLGFIGERTEFVDD